MHGAISFIPRHSVGASILTLSTVPFYMKSKKSSGRKLDLDNLVRRTSSVLLRLIEEGK